MLASNRFKLIRDLGSVQGIVKNIIAPIKVANITNENEAKNLFATLIKKRLLSGDSTTSNFLRGISTEQIYQYYEGCFKLEVVNKIKLDLPLFVFTIMYLESYTLRQIMGLDYLIMKKEIFDNIYTVCEYFHPKSVKFNSTDSFYYLNIFSSFLKSIKLR